MSSLIKFILVPLLNHLFPLFLFSLLAICLATRAISCEFNGYNGLLLVKRILNDRLGHASCINYTWK